MRSVTRQLAILTAIVSTPAFAQEEQAADIDEVVVEALTEAFYEFVPGFPESEWDFDTGKYFSRHAERARDLADGLEFAWSLHAYDPGLVEEMLKAVAEFPYGRDQEKLARYCIAMDQSLVVLRMMYDESTVFPTSGPTDIPGDRLSFFGVGSFGSTLDKLSRTLEPVIRFESDAAFWTHRCENRYAIGEDEFACIAGFYEGPPYDAIGEFRALHESATPRYDLPLRVARLRECADWLDEHGPSVWIAPE